VNFVGADAHLCAEPKPETVAEAAAAIDHHIRGIHQAHEDICPLFILTDDNIGVSGAIMIDMAHGLFQGVDNFYGQDIIQVFGLPVILCGRNDIDVLGCSCTPPDFDIACGQRRLDVR